MGKGGGGGSRNREKLIKIYQYYFCLIRGKKAENRRLVF